jgi:2-haloacid dehalogenase
MIKNIVFDFGGVLIDWNPLYLYNNYFGDEEKARWFIANICTMEWNVQMDAGKSFAEGVAELTAQYPEWADAIAVYDTRWREMVGGPITGMLEVARGLKAAGYHLFGLSNWNWDKFSTIMDDFPVLDELEGRVVSGQEYVIKPDPRIYDILFKRFHLIPSESLFVDDNSANIEGGRLAGMQTLQFKDTAQFVKDLKNTFDIEPLQ